MVVTTRQTITARRRRYALLAFLWGTATTLVVAVSAAVSTPRQKLKLIQNLQSINYDTFPTRTTEEAAVVEWGHSAVISALDGAVASFGPQTSRGAYFEVEASPVLADPVDGVGKDDDEDADGKDEEEFVPQALKNMDDVEGNMLVMTNTANLSGVQMAQIAKKNGAAALMVVNVDQDNPDFIYRLEPETDLEKQYVAEDQIDFPVIMVSLSSANVLTTATVTEGMKKEDIVNNGMPERVRLYAGGDRPFFEDVLAIEPTVYLIHNLLTSEECDALIAAAEGKLEPVIDDATTTKKKLDTLEGVPGSVDGQTPSITNKLERTTLWQGAIAGHGSKQIEERIEQVTAFPREHYSDFTITKFVDGSFSAPHYDVHPTKVAMATITIFLNDVKEGEGGEIVYPSVGGKDGEDADESENNAGPVKILPKKGLAIVHHNTDEEYNFDPTTLHGSLPLNSGVKYIATKWVYTTPQNNARRIVLPLLSAPFGGKLPRFMITVHEMLVDKFGTELGDTYFDKLCVIVPVLILLGISSLISGYVKDQVSGGGGSGGGKGDGKTSKKGSSAAAKKSVKTKTTTSTSGGGGKKGGGSVAKGKKSN